MGHVKSFEEFLFETLNSNSLNEEKLPTFDETAIFSTDPKQKRAENYWPSKYTKEILGKDAKNIARMVDADRWFIDENKKPLSLFKDPQTKNQLMSPEECLAIFKKTEGFVNCHPLILEKIKALPTQVKILEEWLANTEKALQYAIFLSYYGSRYYKKEFGKNRPGAPDRTASETIDEFSKEMTARHRESRSISSSLD
jgi:hypothetical protein